MPDRAAIVEFINSSPKRVGRREIARAFNITGAERNALSKILRELKSEGLIAGGRAEGSLPPVGLATVVDIGDDGALVRPVMSSEDEPALPLHGLKHTRLPASLSVGDRVLVRFVRLGDAEEHEPSHEARLIRRLPQGDRRALGIVAGPRGGPYRFDPVAKRARDDLALDTAGTRVSPGDLVTAEIGGATHHRSRTARVVARHGDASAPGSASLIAIHEHGIADEFPQAVLDEARALKPPDLTGRADLRDLPFITIDPEDARDHDDAVQAEPDPSAGNRGGWIVRVAIADVAHFVRPGSALDREARRRGNSVYFPDRVVPMLPEELSAGLCSLMPGAERAALVVRMVFDKAGALRSHKFERAIIVSRADLSYAEVQDAADGHAGERAAPLNEPALDPLWRAYEVVRRSRERREPLELDLPERRILLDDAGTPIAVVTPPRLEAHRLIEEFMIQANVATAETLEARRSPFLRRVHDAPAPEKVDALAAFLLSLELRLPRGQTMTPAHFNRLIEQAEAGPHAGAVSDAVLRAQSQAHYSARDLGHFGLNLRRYAHFTSPIRRYADIVAHRALISALALGPDGLDRETIAGLDEIGEEVSEAERRAMAAERDTADRLIARFLVDHVGATFAGRVAGIVRSGLFVELDDTGANGFVAAAALGREHDDYFAADEAARSLRGEASGTGYRVGDRVEVRLADADPLKGTLDFEMMTPPRSLPSARATPQRRSRGRPR